MAYEFKRIGRVEFYETDLAGLVHFSNYFRYMERTEHAFFRSLGFSIHPRRKQMVSGWPRVDAQCSFFSPLHFEDNFETHLMVVKKTDKALTYQCRVTNLESEEPTLAAFGTITAIYVTMGTEKDSMKIRATDMPREIFDRIVCAPENLVALHGEGTGRE